MRERETIQVGEERLTREEIAERINTMMAAGDTKISELAEALEKLDKRLLEKAENRLEEAVRYMEVNADIIGNTSPLESSIINTRELLDKKEYEKALDSAFEAIAVINNLREEIYSEKIKGQLDEAEVTIKEKKDQGVDVSASEAIISKARALLNSRKYDEALQLSNSIDELLIRSQKKHMRNKVEIQFQEIRKLMEEAENLGLDVVAIEEKFASAEDHFEREDYIGNMELLRELGKELKDMIDRDLAKHLRSELNSLVELIAQADTMGMDVEEIRKRASQIDTIIEKKGYRAAIDTVSAQRKSLEIKVKGYRRRTSTQKLRELSRELARFQKEAGAEFDDLRDFLDQAFDALERDDFSEVETILEKFLEIQTKKRLEIQLKQHSRDLEIKKNDLDLLREMNIDVEEGYELFEKVKDEIAEVSVEEIEKTMSRLDSVIEEAKNSKAKKMAYRQIKRLKTLLLDMKSKGIDIKGKKKHVSEALEAINNNDFLEGLRLAKNAEKELLEEQTDVEKREAGKLMDDVDGLMKKAVEMWLDVVPLQELMAKAKSSYDSGDLERAMELAREVENKLNEMLNEKNIEIYRWQYDEFIPLLNKAREIGLDVEKETSLISEIERFEELREYDKAIEILKREKPSLEKRIRKYEEESHEKRFEEAEDRFLELEKQTGKEYEDLGSLLDMASTAMDGKDYKKMENILNDFFQIMSQYEKEHSSSRYASDIEEYERLISSMRDVGLNVSEAASLMENSKKALSDSELNEVEKTLSELDPLMEDLRNNQAREMAKNLTLEIDELIKRLKDTGIDIESEEEFFNEIILAVKGKDFLKACKLALKTKRLLRKRKTRFDVVEVENGLSEVKDLRKDLEDKNHISPEWRDRLADYSAEIEICLKEDRPDDAQETLDEFQEIRGKIREDMDKADKISSLIEDITPLSEECESFSINIDDEKQFLAEIHGYLDEYDLDKCMPLLKDVRESLTSKIALYRRDECRSKIEEAREYFEESKDTIEDPNEISSQLDEAEQLLNDELYEKCIELATGLINDIRGIKEDNVVQEIRSLLESSKKLMNETVELGGDTARAEALYYRATYFLEKNDHEKAKEYAKTALDKALKGRLALDQDAAANILREIEKLKRDGEEKGLDVSSMDDLIREARTYVEEADTKEIGKLLVKARIEIERVETTETLRESQKLAEKAGSLWVDVDEIMEMIETAEESLTRGDFQETRNLAEKASRELHDLLNSTYKEKSQIMAKKITPLIKRAMGLGIDIKDEKQRISGLVKLREEGRYKEATEILTEVRSSIEKKNNDKTLDLAREELQGLEEKSGYEYEDLRGLLAVVEKSMEKGDYKGFEKSIGEYNGLKERYRIELSSKRFADDISRIEGELEKFADVGIDITTAGNLMAAVKKSLSANNLKEVQMDLSKLKDIIGDIKSVRIKDLAWEKTSRAEERMEELMVMGIDISKGREVLREARRAIRKGDFIEGTRLSENVMELFDDSKRGSETEELSTEIAKADEYCRKLDSNDYLRSDDLMEMRTLIDNAKEHLENGDIERTREELEQYREKEEELTKQLERIEEIRTMLEDLTILKNEAVKRDIDISEEEENMGDIVIRLRQHRLDDSVSMIEDIRENLVEKLEMKKHRNADDQLARARELLSKYEDVLPDVQNIENSLIEIEGMIDGKEFERAVERAQEAIRHIDESRKKTRREEIEFSLDKLEELIEENDKAGIDVSKGEALFYKAKYYLEKGDYQNAQISMNAAKEKAAEAKKQYEKSNAAAAMEEVRVCIHEEEALELEIGHISKALDEARGLFEEERYGESWELSQGTLDELREMVAEKYLELIQTGIEGLESMIEKGEDIEADMEDEREYIREVDELRKEKRFRDALKVIREGRVSTEEEIARRLKEINAGKMGTAEEELNDFEEETEEEYGDLRSLLDSAQAALAEDDYELLDECLIGFREKKNEHHNAYLTDKYSERSDELEKKMDFLEKLGLKMSSGPDMMNELRQAIESQKFEPVEEIVADIETEIRKTEKVRAKQLARDIIGKTNKMFSELKKLKVDVKRQNQMFKEVLGAVRSRNYIKGIQLTMEARRELKEIRGDYFKKRSSESIELLEKLMDEAEELGIDITSLEDFHSESLGLFDEEKYEDALKAANESHGRYKELRKLHFKDRSSNSMESVLSLKDDAHDLGLDVGEFDVMLEEVQGSHDSEEYEKAFENGEELIRSLNRAIENRLLENIQKGTERLAAAMGEAQQLEIDMTREREGLSKIEELKEERQYREIIDILEDSIDIIEGNIANRLKEINTGKLEAVRAELEDFERDTETEYADLSFLIESMETSLNTKDYESLESHIVSFHNTKEEYLRQYRSDKYTNTVNKLQERMDEIIEVGIPLTDAEELIADIKRSVGDFEFDQLDGQISKVESIVSEATSVTAKDLAKKHFIRTKELIAEMNRAGQDLTEENKVFRKAIGSIKTRDFIAGCRFTLKAEEMVLGCRERYYRRMAETALENARAMVKEGMELDLAVEYVNETIEGAEKRFSEKEYEEVIGVIEEAMVDVRAKRNDHFRDRAESELVVVENIIKEGYELDLDMDSIEGTLSEAKFSFQSEEYEKCIDLVELTENAFLDMRDQYFRGRAESSLSDLERMTREGIGLGIRIEDVESGVSEVTSLFGKGQYESAIEVADRTGKIYVELLKGYHKEKTDAVLETISKYVKEASDFDADITSAKENLEEIRALYDEGQFEEAHELCERTRSDLRETIDNKQLETLAVKMSELEGMMERAKEIEADVAEETDKISAVEGLKEAGKYGECIERVDGIRDILESKTDARLFEIYSNKCDEADRVLFDFLEETGRDYEELRGNIASAREALDEKNYPELENILEGFYRDKGEEKIVFLSDKYTSEITALEEEIASLRQLGLNLEGCDELIEFGLGQIETHEFEEVQQNISEIEKHVEEAKNIGARDIAKRRFLSAKELLAQLKELGPELWEHESVFKEAVSSIKTRDFVKACRLLMETETKVMEAKAAHFKKIGEASFREIHGLMEEAMKLSLDVGRFETSLKESLGLYENGDYEEAAEKASICSAGLRKTTEDRLLDIISGKAENLDDLVRKAEELGADISIEKERLVNTKRWKEEKRYNEVISLQDEMEGLLAKKIETRLHELNTGKLDKIRSVLSVFEAETKKDYEDLQDIISRGESVLEERNYDELEVIIKEFNDVREEHYRYYLTETYTETINGFESDLEIMKEVGIELPEAREIIDSGRDALEVKDFENVKANIDRLEKSIHKAKNVEAKQIAKLQFTSTNKLLMRIKRLDVDLTEEEAMFRQILGAIKQRDFIKSIQLTQSVEEKLLVAEKRHSRKVAQEAIGSLEGMLGDAKKYLLDVIPIEKLHSKAMENFEEENFQSAMELVGQASGEYQEKIKEFLKEMVGGQIKRGEELLEKALDLDIDCEEFKSELESVRNIYRKREYKDAEGIAGKFITGLEEAITYRLQDNIQVRTGELSEVMEESRVLDVDLGNERERLSVVPELRNAEKYEEIIVLLKECTNTIRGKNAARLNKINADKLQQIEDQLGQFREVTGNDYEDLGGIIESARESFDGKDYEMMNVRLDEFTAKKEEHNNRYLAGKYSGEADSYSLKVDELEEIGIPLVEARDQLTVIKELAEVFRFDEIHDRMDEVERVIEKARTEDAKKIAREHFIKVKELMTEMKSAGVDLESERGDFKRAIAAIKANNFIEGSRLTIQAEKTLLEVKEQYYIRSSRDELNNVQRMVSDAMELEIEISGQLVAVEEVCSIFEEHRYMDALERALVIKDELQGMIRGRLTEITENEKEELSSRIDMAKKIGLDVSDVQESLHTLGAMRKEGKHREGIEKIRELRNVLDGEIGARTRQMKEQELNDARQELNSFVDKSGQNFPDLHDHLELARLAFEEMSYHEIDEHLGAFKVEIEKYEKEHRALLSKELLDQKEMEVAMIRDVGIEMPGMDELVSSILDQISTYDFEGLEASIAQMDEMIEKAKNVTAKDLAVRHITEAKQLFGTLSAAGLELSEEESLFKEVLGLVRSGDFLRACSMIATAMEMLSNRQKEYHRDRAANSLVGVENMFQEFRELGLDIAIVEEIMGRANSFFKDEEFIKAEETADDARDRLMAVKEEYHKEKTLGFIREVEMIIRDGIRIGIDISAMEVDVADAYGLIDESRYEDAERLGRKVGEMFREAKADHQREHANTTLAEAQTLMNRAGEMDLDVVSVETLIAYAQIHVEDEEFENAQDLIDQANAMLREMIGDRELEAVDRELGIIEEKIAEARGLGLDISRELEQMSIVDELKLEGKYKEIIVIVQEIKGSLLGGIDVRRKEMGAEGLEAARKKVEDLKTDTGEEHPELLSLLDLASEALGHGDYGKMDDHLSELVSGISEERISLQVKEYLEKIEAIDGEIGVIEQAGIDMTSGREISMLSRRKLEERKIEEVAGHLTELTGMIHEYRTVTARDLTKIRVSEVKAQFTELKEAGIELVEENEQFGLVRAAVSKGNFIDACIVLNDMKKRLNIASDQHLKENAHEAIGKAREVISESNQLGIDTGDITTLVEELEAAFEEGLYDEVCKNARVITDNVHERIREMWHGILEEELAALAPILDEAKKAGLDIEEDVNKISEARLMKDDGRYSEAKEAIGVIKNSLEESIGQEYERLYSGKIRDAYDALTEMEGRFGMELNDLRGCLEFASIAMEERDYDTIVEKLDEFVSIKDEHERLYLGDEYSRRLTDIRDQIERIGALGVDVPEADSLMTAVMDNIAAKNMMKAEGDLKSLEDLLRETNSVRIKEVARDLLTDTKGLLSKAKAENIETEEDGGIFKEAITAIKSKDFLKGCELLVNCKDNIAAMMDDHFRRSVNDVLREMDAFLKEAGELSIDTADVLAALEKSKTGLDEKQFASAHELARRAHDDIRERITVKLGEMLENKVIELNASVKEAPEKGSDISEEIERLGPLNQLREEKRYREAIELVRAVNLSIAEKVTQNVRTTSSNRLDEAYSGFRDFQRMGEEEFNDLEEILGEASKAHDAGNYKAMEDHLSTFYQVKEEHSNRLLARKYGPEISDFTSSMEQFKALGLDTGQGEQLILQAKEAIDTQSFDRMPSINSQLENFMNDVRNVQAKEIAREYLTSTKELLKRVREMGLEAGSDNEIFNDVLDAVRSRDFITACDVSQKLRDSLRTLMNDHLITDSARLLNEVSEQMEEARDIGLDTGPIEVMIGNGHIEMEEGNIEALTQTAQQAKTAFKELMDQYFHNKATEDMDAAGRILEELSPYSLNTDNVKEILASARMENEREMFREASGLAGNAREMLTCTREEFFTSRASRALKTANETLVRCLGYGLDVGVDKMELEKAQTWLDEGSLVPALEMAEKVGKKLEGTEEHYLRKDTSAFISAIWKMMTEGSDLGLDMSAIEDKVGMAQDFFNNGELDRSYEMANTSREELREMIDLKLYDIIQAELEGVSEAFSKATDVEAETSEENEMLQESEDLKEEGEYRKAISVLKKLKESLGAKTQARRKDIYTSKLQENISLLNSMEESGGKELHDLRDILERGGKALEIENFAALDSLFESFKQARSKYNAEIELEKYDARIEELKQKIIQFEVVGIDVTRGREILHQFENCIRDGNFEALEQFSKQITEFVDRAMTVEAKELAKIRIKETRQAFAEVKEKGEDTSEEEAIFGEVVKAVKAEDYVTALESIMKANESLIRKQEQQFMDQVSDYLAETRTLVGEGGDLGLDTKVVEDVLADAQDHFERGDFHQAKELADEARETYADHKRQHLKNRAASNLSAIQELMIDEMDQEVDMVSLDDMIANAKRQFDTGNYTESLEHSEAARTILLKAQHKFSMKNAEAEIERTQVMIDEAVKAGIDISQPEEGLLDARGYFDGEEYKKARETARNIYNGLRKTLDKKMQGEIRSAIAELAPLMETAKRLKLDVRDDREALSRIDSLKDDGKYHEALSTVVGIHTSVKNKIHLHRRRGELAKITKISDILEGLERDLGVIPETSVDISRLRDCLESAQAAMEVNDPDGVDTFVQDFFKLEGDMREQFLAEVYPKVLDHLEGEIRILGEIGITLAVAEELVGSAREQIQEGNLDIVRELRKQIFEIAKDARSGPAKEVAKKHITGIKTLFRELKEMELDVGEEQAMFASVSTAVKEADFVGATKLMLNIKDKLTSKRLDYFSNTIGDTLSEIDRIIRKAVKKKLDVKKFRKMAFEARALLKRKRYDRANELAQNAYEQILKVWEKTLEENAWVAVEEVTALVRESAGTMEDGRIKELLEQARQERSQGKYRQCLEHVEDIKKMIRDLRQEGLMVKATEKLTDGMGLISEAEKAGLDTEEIKKKQTLAQESFDGGRYQEAIDAIREIEDELTDIRIERARDAVSSQLKEFNSFVEVMATKPYFTEAYKEDIRGKIERIAGLEGEEILAAEEMMGELRKLLESLLPRMKLEDEYILLSKQAEKLINRAKENRIEIAEEEERYGKAMELREGGDLQGANTLLKEINEALMGTVGGLIKEKAEAELSDTRAAIDRERDRMDVTLVEERLLDGKDSFDRGDYEGCLEICAEVRDILHEILEKKSEGEVVELVGEARKELENTKKMGFDIFDVEAYIFKASMAFDSQNFSRARELALKAIDSAKRAREGIDEGKIRIMLRETETLTAEGGELGVDMGMIESGITEAENYLAERRLKEANKLAEDLNSSAKEMIDVKLIEIIPQRVQALNTLMEEAKEAGADVEEDEVALIPIDALTEEGRYLGAMKLIMQIQPVIEEKLAARKVENAASKLELAFKDLASFKESNGGEHDDLEDILERALNASTEGNIPVMNGGIQEYYEKKAEKENLLLSERYEKSIDELEEKLSSVSSQDFDITRGEELLASARVNLTGENFDEVRIAVDELEVFLDFLYTEKMKPDAENNIKEIDRMMDLLRERGVEVKEEEEMFSSILTAMDDEDYVTAYEASNRLKINVEQIWSHRRKDMLYSNLEEAEQFSLEVEKKTFISDQYKEILKSVVEELREHYNNDEFELMEEKYEIYKATMEDLNAEIEQREKVEKLLADGMKLRETGESLAADISKEAGELEKIKSMVENEEFDEAGPLLEKIIKVMKKKINVRRMSIAKMVLEDALAAFNERKDKIEAGTADKAKNLIKDATAEYKKGKFETAINISKEAKSIVEKADDLTPPEAPKEESESPPVPEESTQPPWSGAAPAPAPTPKKVKLKCPKCSKAYAAQIAQVPAVAMCPYCGSKAVIKSI